MGKTDSDALKEDIPDDKIYEIRLKMTESVGHGALEYAAIALGILVVWASLLGDAGRAGDGNWSVWIIEGLLVSGAGLAVMNSAFYGRMAGLISAMISSIKQEHKIDKGLPYERRRDDYMSRLMFRYAQETKEVLWLRPFGNVFSQKKVLSLLIIGIAVGLVLAFI